MTNSANRFSILISLLLITTFSYLDYAVTALLMLIAGVWIFRLQLKANVIHHYSMTNIMLFYLVWLGVMTLCSSVPSVSSASLVVLVGMPLMYLVATNFYGFSQSWRAITIILMLVATLVSGVAVWQVMFKIGNGFASGPFNDRNAFAALLNLLWFFFVYLFFNMIHKNRTVGAILLSCVLLLMGLAFFATSSRGGILTWLLLMPILLWVGFRNTRSLSAVAIVLSLSLVAYFMSDYVLHSSIAERSFNVAKDASSHARIQIWQAALKMAIDHPVIGTGWGTFGYFYSAYRLPIEKGTAGFFAHNDYLQYASEGGLVAVLILLIILVLLLHKLKSQIMMIGATSFESVALLLGVVALFIHALVNFIFYFAFMSSLAGLYLARASVLTETPTQTTFPNINSIRSPVKKLLGYFLLLVIATPYVTSIIAQLCLAESRPGMKAINLFAPNVTAFDLANVIAAVQPNEGLAQEYLLRTYEYYLTGDGPYVNQKDGAAMLNDALSTFDTVRKKYANAALYGTREIKLLLANQNTYDALTKQSGAAIKKAYQILDENLKADPYHGYSWVMLARLQFIEGKKQEAIKTLDYAYFNVLTIRDQQLVMVERLRQLGLPKVYPALDTIETELLRIKSNVPGAITHQEADEVYASVELKLKEIAGKIDTEH